MPMPGHAFRTDVDESKYSKAIKVDVEPPFNTWRVELESIILDKRPELQQVSGDVLEYAFAARLEHAGWLTMDGDKATSLWGEETVT